jgi:hypothetical protein
MGTSIYRPVPAQMKADDAAYCLDRATDEYVWGNPEIQGVNEHSKRWWPRDYE